MPKNLKAAIDYIKHGWSIIPIKPGEKVPLLNSWLEFQKRQATESEVTEWFTKWPDANLAIIVGQISGLLVIDIDDLVVGEKSFRKYFGDIITLAVKTPNGIHYYFKHPGDKQISNAIRAAPGLDIKGDGGYVLAPPSVGYEWIKNIIVDLPNQTLLTEVKTKIKVNLGNTENILEGGRDNNITQKAGKLLAMKHSVEETFGMCQAYNLAYCKPPLPERDIKRIVTSIASREQEKPKKVGEIIDISFEDIQEEKIEWLWPGVLPKGKLSLFEGDPGHGKSLLSVEVAACVSAGKSFPDGTTPEIGKVIMVFCEDGAGDTVKPRLRIAGANLKNVRYFDLEGRFPELDKDLDKIEQIINKHDAKLLTIDPLSNYLGKTDSWKDDKVRTLMSKVGALAAKTNCAVLCIMHLNKRVSSNAIDRGMGSVGFAAVSRSVFLVGEYPEENDDRKILVPVKANLTKKDKSLIFRINSSEDDYPYIEWMGESNYNSSDILAKGITGLEEDSKLEQAIRFLQEQLREGEKLGTLIYDLGDELQLSRKTIERARSRLGVISYPLKEQGGKWFWKLSTASKSKDENDPFSSL